MLPVPDGSSGTTIPPAPQLSVVIPIYNGEADLPDLLTCLEQQTYAAERVEYLLVDNASSDRTAEILQAQAAKRSNVFYLSETAIQSAYAARNTGIRAASGDILVFTDADCRPHCEWLSRLVQPFADPTVGLVAGEVVALPGDTLLERYADRHNTLSQKHTLAHPFSPYGQTANLAVRRAALQAVGLFRPYLTTGGDADLCWRILRQSQWQIQFAEQAIVRHRHRSTLAELQSQWRRYGRSNRYLHELHGVSLGREITAQDYLYRLSRWLLKEIPIAATTRTIGVLDAVLDTPLDLLCWRARMQGQRQATLPAAAREIVWLQLASLHSAEPELKLARGARSAPPNSRDANTDLPDALPTGSACHRSDK